MPSTLPVGKLPASLLEKLISQAPISDTRVLFGPGIGRDCAVLDMGERLLVVKTDPITFATQEIGWYAVQVNTNDIATTGAIPRWFMLTLLLPESSTTPELVETITAQVYSACRELGISVVGGHTEITYGLDRPILVGTLIGEVDRDKLVTPQGANTGDSILLTKGVPIEATSIIAHEFPDRLAEFLASEEIQQAKDYLHDPGISVLRDAQIATEAGKVTAMHDPTEGGLASALWELAIASQRTLVFDPSLVLVPPLPAKICQALELDPLAAIASGALLLTAPPQDAEAICRALHNQDIPCQVIGTVYEGTATVWKQTPNGRQTLPQPSRDEVARLFDN